MQHKFGTNPTPSGTTGHRDTGDDMWFLIKGTFYSTVALVALSFLAAPPREEVEGGPQFNVTDAFTAVSGAYDYVSSLCVEKPDVCESGRETLQAIGARAREGALVAYQLIDAQLSGYGEPGTVADAIEAAPPLKRGHAVEIVQPAAAPVEMDAPFTTGTVTPTARPGSLPQPYRKPVP